MNLVKKAESPLEDIKVHVKIKLAALWASAMFCYIYADYFGLFQPGSLQAMLQGKMAPFGPTTQGILVFTSAMMVVPSVMIFLSVALRPKPNRLLNIVFGVLYTLIILATLPGSWAFYFLFGFVEVALTSLIAWYAWTWPRQAVP